MIFGKTKSGFEYQVEKSKLDNMELLDEIAEVDRNPLAISRVVMLLLGQDQRKRLYEHCRTPDGNVPIKAVTDEVVEIFQGSGAQGKN